MPVYEGALKMSGFLLAQSREAAVRWSRGNQIRHQRTRPSPEGVPS
jgi:hypothetical protein